MKRSGLALAFLAAGLALVPAVGSAGSASATVTSVTVTMKEFKFAFSRTSVPVGTVVFKLVNRGKVPHDFRIAGKKSALVKPGGTGVLRVTFSKGGSYPFVCTVPGHASAGMKGVLAVGKGTPAPVPGVKSSVDVAASEFAFALSQQSVPAGEVTFVVTNQGAIVHNFRINGKTTPLLDSGKSASITVVFTKPGSYPYECTIPGHAVGGMKGVLTVT
jgi:uncharacterized cupredoxin-like copper-binding protein